MCFKVYGYISMTQAITFLQDFKLGHYMKIPPRTMFMAQVIISACFILLAYDSRKIFHCDNIMTSNYQHTPNVDPFVH